MSSTNITRQRAVVRLPDGAEFVIESNDEQNQRNRAVLELLRSFDDPETEEERAMSWEVLKRALDEVRAPDEKLFP